MKKLRKKILDTFVKIKKEADDNQICKRKGVGAAIVEIDIDERKVRTFTAINGPSGAENECSDVIGACGCSHAEPRVILKFLKETAHEPQYLPPKNIKRILLSTYSPCVPCANLAIDSEIIDMFIYEIWTPHWNKGHFHADAALNNSDIVYWSYDQLTSHQGQNKLMEWLNV